MKTKSDGVKITIIEGNVIMDALVEGFINFIKNDKHLSLNTLQSYKRDIEQYINYLSDIKTGDVTNVKKASIIAYLLHLKKIGKATSTISRNLASIRSFYQYMINANLIDEDPTIGLESPKVERKLPQILSTKEVERLLDQPKCVDLKGFRDKAMLELLYATGIRVSELISLNLDDIKLNAGYILCNKGTRERIIPVGSIAMKSVQEYLKKARSLMIRDKSQEALFVNINGRRLTRQGFWKIIKQYKNQAKINKDITPHHTQHCLLRHICWTTDRPEINSRNAGTFGHIVNANLHSSGSEQNQGSI